MLDRLFQFPRAAVDAAPDLLTGGRVTLPFDKRL